MAPQRDFIKKLKEAGAKENIKITSVESAGWRSFYCKANGQPAIAHYCHYISESKFFFQLLIGDEGTEVILPAKVFGPPSENLANCNFSHLVKKRRS